LVRHTADIETIVVKEEGGTPVFVRDVAEVRIGHIVRHGAAVLNGEREVVAGIVLMLRDANAKEVVEGVVGLTANLMTLGGLAIAIGEIADGAVVVVENVHRHLSDPATQSVPRWEVVRDACLEVARPIAFGILIVTVVFLPFVTLEGVEGKMFKPLAYTISASWRAQRGWSRGRWRWCHGSAGNSCRFWTRAR
jgi:Cu/Ag efflux pump CusA